MYSEKMMQGDFFLRQCTVNLRNSLP